MANKFDFVSAYRVTDDKGKQHTIVAAKGWVSRGYQDNPWLREITGTEKPFATFQVAVRNGSKTLEYAFGPMWSGAETAYITVNANDRILERLKAAKVEPGCLLLLFGETVQREFTKKDGTKGTQTVLYLRSFEVERWVKTTENASAPAAQAKPATVAAATTTAATPYDAEDFEAIEDENDLPF